MALDGGGLLFRSANVGQNLASQAKINATGIVDAYNLMAFDAVGVSSRDLAAGVDFLIELQGRAKFSWLSANLLDRKTGRRVFEPYLKLQVGNQRVAIIGLTDLAPELNGNIGDGYQLLDWPEVLPSIITELRDQSDFIILLTGYDLENCREIATSWPQINLIIPAFGIDNRAPTLLSASTLYTQTEQQGKYLGVLTIHPQPGGKWDRGEKELLAKKKSEADRLSRQTERIRDRPAYQGRYHQLLQRRGKLEQEIIELEGELRDRPALNEGSTFEHQFVALSPKLPDDQEVISIINRTQQLVEKSGQSGLITAPGPE